VRSARRNTELGLIILVVMITGGAYVLGSLSKDAVIPPNVGPFLGVVLALFLVAHIVVRRLAPNADGTLLPIAGLLNGLGFVIIARISPKLAWQQAAWTTFGIAAFCVTLMIVKRARDLDRYRWTLALLGIILLLMPLIPGLGEEHGSGSRIWISLPGGMSFQPGEMAKIVLAIFFASYLVEKRELLAMGNRQLGPISLPDLKHFGPVILAWVGSLVVLVYQKDLGSSLLFFAMFIVMLWVATERFSFVVIGLSLFSAGAFFAYQSFTHVQERVAMWIDPWQDPQGKGFQVVQSAFEMASGGIGGTGIGLDGVINIPEAESDFIFAIIAGELGLLGALIVLVAFLLIVGAGLRIAVRAENAFDKLLATGLTALIGVQAFVIIGGVTRVLPLTGVTLPFVSYGGSSLIANYILIALLMRISDETPLLANTAASERELVLR
jgi:cell division protein FtsW (lipid II flippase)